VVARVKENYLYKSELKQILPPGISEQDSLVLVNSYINRWARQQLLMDGAQRNLSYEQQQEYDELVTQYRNDLYSKAYLDRLVLQNIDTVISNEESESFYTENKESFKLNEDLIKLRYIKLAQSALNLEEVTQRFRRFDSLDRPYLDSISVHFKSFSLKDSIWVGVNQVAEKIPVIEDSNKTELLKISNFIQLKDSINLYLIQVVDVRRENDYAPLQYVTPSVKQMVMNKRKLELTKQLESDILKDAIRTKEFEIYEE